MVISAFLVFSLIGYLVTTTGDGNGKFVGLILVIILAFLGLLVLNAFSWAIGLAIILGYLTGSITGLWKKGALKRDQKNFD